MNGKSQAIPQLSDRPRCQRKLQAGLSDSSGWQPGVQGPFGLPSASIADAQVKSSLGFDEVVRHRARSYRLLDGAVDALGCDLA